MTGDYLPPRERCANCEHATEVEVYSAGGERAPRWMCERRMPHATEPNSHCRDWEARERF